MISLGSLAGIGVGEKYIGALLQLDYSKISMHIMLAYTGMMTRGK